MGIVSIGRTCREVQILRDSGVLQSIMCSSIFEWFQYVDTKEVRLIQGLFGAPVKIPLVKVEVDIAGRREKFVCGMVERLLSGVTMLIGNDYSELFPLSVSAVTRARLRMNDCNSDAAVVHSEVANGHVNED